MASTSRDFVQDSADRTKDKTIKTIELIKAFTGKCAPNSSTVLEIKKLVENLLSQKTTEVGDSECPISTVPTDDGTLFESLKDWSQLCHMERNDHKNFLEENYDYEELQLAYDEYFAKYGDIPETRQFRVFILQWQGRRRRKNHLAEMYQKVQDLEGQNTNLNMNQEQFRNVLDNAMTISNNQQSEIQRLMTDHLNLQNRMEQVLHTAGQLQVNNQRILGNNTQLQNECLRMHAEATQLQADVTAKENAVVHLTSQNTEKDNTITHLSTQNKEKDNTIKEKDNTITHLSTQNKEKDNTITHLTHENEKNNDKIKDLKVVNRDLCNTLREKEELCDMKDRQLKKQCLVIEELQHEVSETQDRLESLEKGLENKMDEIKSLKSDHRQQQNHIQAQDSIIAGLKEQSKAQEQINKQLFLQLEELKRMMLKEKTEAAN